VINIADLKKKLMVAIKKAETACRANFAREIFARCKVNYSQVKRQRETKELLALNPEERQLISSYQPAYELDRDQSNEFPLLHDIQQKQMKKGGAPKKQKEMQKDNEEEEQ
jgi:hypothetical protein